MKQGYLVDAFERVARAVKGVASALLLLFFVDSIAVAQNLNQPKGPYIPPYEGRDRFLYFVHLAICGGEAIKGRGLLGGTGVGSSPVDAMVDCGIVTNEESLKEVGPDPRLCLCPEDCGEDARCAPRVEQSLRGYFISSDVAKPTGDPILPFSIDCWREYTITMRCTCENVARVAIEQPAG